MLLAVHTYASAPWPSCRSRRPPLWTTEPRNGGQKFQVFRTDRQGRPDERPACSGRQGIISRTESAL